jgi:Tfp pilus assembly protein PilF
MADGPAMGPPATVAKPVRADEMLRPAPRPGHWMHKVWPKEARVVTWQPHSWGPALAAAEQALRESPDSRDRHRKLVQLLSRNGDIERAQQIAEQWLERDRLDAEALTALADLLARQGEREEALRWLSGIVDLEPDNKALHERMARAYERLGAADRACSHRIVLAELSPSDFAAVGAALRCDRATDWQGAADAFLPHFRSDGERRRAQGLAMVAPPRVPAHGEVVLDATWNRGDDLDLALISPQGTRISWMGGRKSVFADRVADAGSERLGLGVVSPGTYRVEISRTNTTELQPVRGRIRLSALGIRQDLPFSLLGRQVVAATLVIERKWHLEPVRPRW